MVVAEAGDQGSSSEALPLGRGHVETGAAPAPPWVRVCHWGLQDLCGVRSLGFQLQ